MSWSQEQLSNVAAIIKAGHDVGASDRDIVIAIGAAIVESGLRNLDHGDRDSIGLFQQRDAWGSRGARLDPYQSAKMFFTGGAAGQRGLLDFKNRDGMGMGEAAQAVQVSAFPDRYQQHMGEAQQLAGNPNLPAGPAGTVNVGTQTTHVSSGLDELQKAQDQAIKDFQKQQSMQPQDGALDVTANAAGLGELKFDDGGQTDAGSSTADKALAAQTFDNQQAVHDPMSDLHLPTLQDVLNKMPNHGVTSTSFQPGDAPSGAGGQAGKIESIARKYLGTPYVWGGTSPTGFDCSGFVQYVFRQVGVNLPRISADQARSGTRIHLKDLKAGDLVAWDNSSRNNGADHIAIYIGNGQIIEAPRPGASVQISHLYDQGEAWGVRL